MRGFFITLEGIDGCGKSTQLDMLAAALAARGFSAITTRQPGGTPTGQAIRSLVIDEHLHSRLTPMAELLLMIADRAQHVAEIIRPNLEAGRVVVSDRYIDSSVAFQGYGRGIDIAIVDELNALATGGLTPDLTILFDLDIETAQERLNRRANIASEMRGFDEEQRDFHVRVRDGYLELAKRHPGRFRVMDATAGVDETHEQVLALALALLRTED